MSSKYSSGKHSISECDRCGFRYKLKELRKLTIKTKQVSIKVCRNCWEPDQPQLSLGLYPVNDPQAVREPRPDLSYRQSGYSGLQIFNTPGTSVDENGFPGGGSRVIQWGWNPIGFGNGGATDLDTNNLVGYSAIGTLTVAIT